MLVSVTFSRKKNIGTFSSDENGKSIWVANDDRKLRQMVLRGTRLGWCCNFLRGILILQSNRYLRCIYRPRKVRHLENILVSSDRIYAYNTLNIRLNA